jgi:glucose-6-phosphate 1-dehydrogenase
MPHKFAILALGRKKFTTESFRESMRKGISEIASHPVGGSERMVTFMQNLYYLNLDVSDPDDFSSLATRLSELDKMYHTEGNILFYLAMPPGTFIQITKNLKKQNLHLQKNKSSWRRIVFEKPFGHNLDSARKLNSEIQTIFNEDQIYRIDHYLGKETVQNVCAFRFSNTIFEALWNRNHIHHIQITASEKIGVGDRGGYYDHAGAMRDMVQNHLLQIAAVIAMEPPVKFDSPSLHNEKIKVFKALRPIGESDIASQIIRGQYLSSKIQGKKVKAYREEKGVDKDSTTETFVAMKMYIDNWRWGDVPFYIRTGKHLPTRVTEVVIHFNKIPYQLFSENATQSVQNNLLILRIQPDEGILVKFGMKLPGANYNIKTVDMDFHYSDLSETHLPEAYERLLLDVIFGDSSLYARSDEVEASWEFINPILEAWQKDPTLPIYGYPAGTWGPPQARTLFDHPDEDWRYPCKNLTGADNYCEL